MCIPCGLLFIWVVVPSFRFRVSIAASQTKPDFGTLKMEKAPFVGRKKIGFHGVPRHPKDHALVRYGLVPTNYAIIRAEPSPFELKVVQPRMLWVISVKELSGKLLFSRL
jgi:hypothetical protein